MAAGDGAAGNVGGPVAPYRQRPAGVLVPRVETAPGAPQHEHRTWDAATRAAILRIPCKVDGGGRTIFLADGMHRVGLAQGLDIGCADFWRKARSARARYPASVVQKVIRI